jgi:hypothetical protein
MPEKTSLMSPVINSDSLGCQIVFRCAADGVPPIIVKIANWPGKFFAANVNAKLIAANSAKLLKWNFSLLQH